MNSRTSQPNGADNIDPGDLRRFERVRDLLAEVIDLPPAQRGIRIDELAGNDPPLRSAVHTLLANLEAAEREGFLADPDPGGEPVDQAPLPSIDWIGPYRVIRMLGEGGSGVVYLAESPPPLYRRVAVKIARAHAGTRSASRAAVEAEALASLNHPGIAQVYETGVLDDGRRWIACEWIKGTPADKAAKHLDWRTRIVLLRQAAEAVHHVHQRGVIHRDLKPSNLLVTCDGVNAGIKVIDFGVARLMDAHDKVRDITEHGLLVGTLAYMSPEQLDAGEADARTDVYALGLVACEMLNGSPPPGRSGGLAELTAAVRAPVRARLTGCAGHEGDLAAIIARATEPNPSRRYPSMQHLADDLRRVLEHLPIEARATGAAHRARLYAERHPLLSSAAVLTIAVISVLIGMLVSSRARLAAEVRDQQQLVGGLVGDALLGLREVRGTRESRLAMVDALMARVKRHAENNPQSEELQLLLARTLRERGDIAAGIGRFDDAERDLLRSLEIYRESHRRDSADIDLGRLYAEGLIRIGDVQLERERALAVDTTMDRYLQAMRIQQQLLATAPDHPGLLDDLTWSYDRIGELGDLHDASMPHGDVESWMLERIDISRQLVSLDPERVLSQYSLGAGYMRLARHYGNTGRFADCYHAVVDGLPAMLFAVRAEPNRMPFVQTLLGLYSWEVKALLGMDRHDGVPGAVRRLVDAAHSQANAQPGDLLAEQALVSVLTLAADAMKRVGDRPGSRAFAKEAIARFEALESMVSPARWAELHRGLSSMREMLAELE